MTPGQAAYEKWASLVFIPSLPWVALPEDARKGWDQIAQAAIEENRVQERLRGNR